jgi:hypothetical protein
MNYNREVQLLIAIVRVEISSLSFTELDEANLISREVDSNITNYLLDIFRSSPNGCNRDQQSNHLTGFISSIEDLNCILESSGLQKQDLTASIATENYPTLRNLEIDIQCMQGRHRLLAASEFFPTKSDHWWTVDLYLIHKESE